MHSLAEFQFKMLPIVKCKLRRERTKQSKMDCTLVFYWSHIIKRPVFLNFCVFVFTYFYANVNSDHSVLDRINKRRGMKKSEVTLRRAYGSLVVQNNVSLKTAYSGFSSFIFP